jgi:hypothetical protein
VEDSEGPAHVSCPDLKSITEINRIHLVLCGMEK